jgi:hypothetical protein
MSTISRDRTRRHPSRCRIWLLEVKGAPDGRVLAVGLHAAAIPPAVVIVGAH